MKHRLTVRSILLYYALSNGCLPFLHSEDWSKLNLNIGGGVTTPLNPTANYAGVSGNFDVGVGYNLDKRSSITGEFLWNGLPPNLFVVQPVLAPFGKVNLFTLGVNYRYHIDRLGQSPFGVYILSGGGWYNRHASVDKNFVVPPGSVCQPVYTWWGYGCDANGFVFTETIAEKATNAGGVNGGVGFTIRFGDSGWKFYVESRYHYAWSPKIPSVVVPVTFGIRFH